MKAIKYLIVVFLMILTLAVSACDRATPTSEPTPTTLPPSPTLSTTAPLLPTPTPIPSPELILTPLPPSEIAKSSVRIDAFVENNGKMVLAWNGSGTIISADGLILTNAHVVVGADELIINIISEIDQPPIPTYYAELVNADYILDLALIQITTDLDGNEVVLSELDLPKLMFGASGDTTIGQGIHIFGYPGVGGDTITFSEGSISGFESADLGNGSERIWIKTDADIAPGNSGGTAVDDRGLLVGIPSAGVRSGEGETLGRLRPIDLTSYILSKSCAPFACKASVYEPNDDFWTAFGPLESGKSYTAYIHPYDFDIYKIEVETLVPIEINLTDIADGVDYDLGLYDAGFNLLDTSEGEKSSERIVYSPAIRGIYYIVVAPYQGYDLQEPYVIQAIFNGESEELGNVSVRGRLLDANTGDVIVGATIGLLVPGMSGEEFMESDYDERLVQVWSITDIQGEFVLENVPRGEIYSGFVALEDAFLWQNEWLIVRRSDPDIIDVGDIEVSAE